MIRRSDRHYDVYHHHEDGWRAVRRGFSWLAFLAPAAWAALRQFRGLTTVLIVLTTLAFELTSVAGQIAPNPVSQFVILTALLTLLGLRPGFDGWKWRNESLRARRFEHRGTVPAPSGRVAIRSLAGGSGVDLGGLLPT